MDLGIHFSDRLDWFYQVVIDGNGQYVFTDVATTRATTTFEFSFTAGSCAVAGKGNFTQANGEIIEPIIER